MIGKGSGPRKRPFSLLDRSNRNKALEAKRSNNEVEHHEWNSLKTDSLVSFDEQE
jgi:hypothetical protein